MGSEAPHLRFPDSPIVRPQPERIIAIGDLHGDVAATRRALRLARVLHPRRDVWTGGKTVVVQVGDQLDRGDDELAVLSLLQRLSTQPEAAGGALDVLWGNHELMASQGKFRYATPGACDTFTRWAKVCMWRRVLPPPIAHRFHCNLWGEGTMACGGDDADCRAKLERLPQRAHARYLALRPGGPVASSVLAHKRKAAVIVGDTLFVHAGLKHQDILRNFLRGQDMRGSGGTPAADLSLQGGEYQATKQKVERLKKLQDKWEGWGWGVGWDGGVGREQRWERELALVGQRQRESDSLAILHDIHAHLEAFFSGRIAGDALSKAVSGPTGLLWDRSVSKGLGIVVRSRFRLCQSCT